MIIVLDGLLWLVLYVVFVDGDLKYLSELFRIWLILLLISLKLIVECLESYYNRNGVLFVGDLWVDEIIFEGKWKIFLFLFVRKEVEMIGKIFKVMFFVGKEVMKVEVFKWFGLVVLVYIVVNIYNEYGEIVFFLNLE